MKDFSKKNNLKFKGFGLYQIIGGAIGIYSIVAAIVQASSLTNVNIAFVIIPICLYAYSIYCGNLLLQRKKKGFNLTVINQSLQLINFSVFGFYFKYISGLLVSFGISFTPLYSWKINIEPSTFQVNWHADPKLFEVHLNLVALFLIYSIRKSKKQLDFDEQHIIISGKEDALPPL